MHDDSYSIKKRMLLHWLNSFQIPAVPDPTVIACRQIMKGGFNLEWNEPQTYGGNEIGGYHVSVVLYKKIVKSLFTIPALRVNVTAFVLAAFTLKDTSATAAFLDLGT